MIFLEKGYGYLCFVFILEKKKPAKNARKGNKLKGKAGKHILVPHLIELSAYLKNICVNVCK